MGESYKCPSLKEAVDDVILTLPISSQPPSLPSIQQGNLRAESIEPLPSSAAFSPAGVSLITQMYSSEKKTAEIPSTGTRGRCSKRVTLLSLSGGKAPSLPSGQDFPQHMAVNKSECENADTCVPHECLLPSN